MKKMEVNIIIEVEDEEDTTNVSEVMIDWHKRLEENVVAGNYKLLSLVCQELGETSIYALRRKGPAKLDEDSIRFVG